MQRIDLNYNSQNGTKAIKFDENVKTKQLNYMNIKSHKTVNRLSNWVNKTYRVYVRTKISFKFYVKIENIHTYDISSNFDNEMPNVDTTCPS